MNTNVFVLCCGGGSSTSRALPCFPRPCPPSRCCPLRARGPVDEAVGPSFPLRRHYRWVPSPPAAATCLQSRRKKRVPPAFSASCWGGGRDDLCRGENGVSSRPCQHLPEMLSRGHLSSQVAQLVHRLFSRFDRAVRELGLFKMDTVRLPRRQKSEMCNGRGLSQYPLHLEKRRREDASAQREHTSALCVIQDWGSMGTC